MSWRFSSELISVLGTSVVLRKLLGMCDAIMRARGPPPAPAVAVQSLLG
jgi:hypothetical protein